MPEIKNTFLKSKMNKDLDSRIIPNGEYRDGQNISISSSEGASVGALENIRGNKLLTNFGLAPIGEGASEAATAKVRITSAGHMVPTADDTYDLGSSSLQWRDIYTGDLNLNNTKTRNNEVDGTSGSWTIQEGKDDLYLLNRLNGKKYKFNLTEVE